MRLTTVLLLWGLLLLLGTAPARADVKPGGLFCDNAVLQRNKPIIVWGTADPGESVVVSFATAKSGAIADSDGNWKITLPAMAAGGPYDMEIQGKNLVSVKNVLVGEVWLCGGQSNMVLPLSYARHAKDDIDKSNIPSLRLFTLADNLNLEACSTIKGGKWEVATPRAVKDWSAVSFFYGRMLQTELNVPVGIICSAYQGTPIKVWMSPVALDAIHESQIVNLPDNYVALKEDYDKKMVKWRDEVMQAREKGLEEPSMPVLPPDFYAPASAFNGMINPLIPFGMRGVFWYQGEADTNYPYKWHRSFASMVNDWRQRWSDPKMPFIYVQLPSYDKRAAKPGESQWAELREGQLLARRVPYAHMIVTIDTARGDEIDLHPREKKEIAERAACTALATVYRKPKPYSGPIYDSMEVDGDKIKLLFRHAEKGLVVKGDKAHGFEIAGADKRFVPAQATIDGSSVIVSSDKIQAPVAVRYGWASNPDVNLYNKDDLPASPFRTDHWAHQVLKKMRL